MIKKIRLDETGGETYLVKKKNWYYIEVINKRTCFRWEIGLATGDKKVAQHCFEHFNEATDGKAYSSVGVELSPKDLENLPSEKDNRLNPRTATSTDIIDKVK